MVPATLEPAPSASPGCPVRRRLLRAAVAAPLVAPVAGLIAPAARAQVTVEGYTYVPTIDLGGRTLYLNGVGLRAVAWFKGYAAGLYLGAKVTTVEAVLADAGPKRMQLRMFVDVPAAEFSKAFFKGVKRNAPAAQQPQLAARMQRFDEMVMSVGEVKNNDVVNLDFLPDQGLVFSRNGRALGPPIPGADFYAALLLIFIGQRPVDKEMKIGLLGGPVG